MWLRIPGWLHADHSLQQHCVSQMTASHRLHTCSHTDLHSCASGQGACWGGQSSAETATHYYSHLYSRWRGRRQEGHWKMYSEYSYVCIQSQEVFINWWPCSNLGLLFLDETLRGGVPVALGGCLHHTVFVVMLQKRKEKSWSSLCGKPTENCIISHLWDNISDCL